MNNSNNNKIIINEIPSNSISNIENVLKIKKKIIIVH